MGTVVLEGKVLLERKLVLEEMAAEEMVESEIGRLRYCKKKVMAGTCNHCLLKLFLFIVRKSRECQTHGSVLLVILYFVFSRETH